MRAIFLDCETTGVDATKGHRLIGIGCLEMVDGELTGRSFHAWLNPSPVQMEPQVEAITGISNRFLEDKPSFADIASDFLAFIDGAELVLHGAEFDLAFIRKELQMAGFVPEWAEQHCTIVDVRVIASERYPGKRTSIAALCERLGVTVDVTTYQGILRGAARLAGIYQKLEIGNEQFKK